MPRLSKIGAAALGAFGWTSGSSISASYLVVAGGGSGGYSGGGGGAGGYLTGTASLNPTLSYTVTVGGGGASVTNLSGIQGNSSTFNSVTASGGGAGGYYNTAGGAGGSGGGGGANATFGAGTSGQGNNGGAGGANSAVFSAGGGGGASAVGGTGNSGGASGSGGNGTASSITGSSVTYAGGGGGSNANGSGGTAGSGGTGGGGAGSVTGNGVAGTANLGGGGGGCYAGGGGVSGQGGSGVVIISYLGAQQFGGGVVTSSGGNTIHTFNTSGTLAPLSSLTANFLVVAGGGAGGNQDGGGGGAGGYRTSAGTSGGGASAESTLTIDTNSIYLVTVGAGGTTNSSATGSNGSNSSFLNITSTGGGGGGYPTPAIGGSGGGGRYGVSGAAGTANQGYAGGAGGPASGVFAGGGGGGAGAVGATGGATGGNGGSGVTSSISGSSVTYAGGGGGGTFGGTNGTGGSGGGGNAGSAGTANTGGGGGGGFGNTDNGGAGGSGVVVIAYAGATQQMAGGTVTISGGNVIHTFTSSGYLTPLKYVNNSLRFRSSASAYLNRTPASAGNRQKWTWSAWVKRGALSYGEATLFNAGTTGIGTNDTGFLGIRFTVNDQLDVTTGATDLRLTTQVFRDPAAWYHIVVAFDTTQATGANRVKVYINGTQVTAYSGTDPSLNLDTAVNNTNVHEIARTSWNGAGYYDGYTTEVNFIDGLQLTPNSFGTFNSYGVWQPITYGGSYGTNGFYLPFTNTTSTTTLGYDFSPTGNNWTTNNISLTAGSTYDSMTDVPTLTSATTANYAVFNPVNVSGGGSTITNGNLATSVGSTTTFGKVLGSIGMTTGKWYWEVTITAVGSIAVVGIGDGTPPNGSTSLGGVAGEVSYLSNGNKYTNSVSSAYGSSYTTNDVIGVAYDADAGSITFYKNNTSQGAITGFSGIKYAGVSAGGGTNPQYAINFGQQPFQFTPPSGFVALNTYNL
jgi:hypothetical protein